MWRLILVLLWAKFSNDARPVVDFALRSATVLNIYAAHDRSTKKAGEDEDCRKTSGRKIDENF